MQEKAIRLSPTYLQIVRKERKKAKRKGEKKEPHVTSDTGMGKVKTLRHGTRVVRTRRMTVEGFAALKKIFGDPNF